MIHPENAELLKWTCPPYIFGTVHYHFMEISRCQALESDQLIEQSLVMLHGCTGLAPVGNF